jgi:hypothetical protein
MWERLFLRPELAAYEATLARRVAGLSAVDDPRLVPLRSVERDPDTSRVVVVSHHLSGVRLSDVLRSAREHEVIPDLTVAIFLAAEILAALHAFHQVSGVPHGIVAAERIVVSSAGDLVLTDYVYAEVIQTARFSPSRLWEQFGVAPWPGEQISFAGDVRQAALVTIAVMLGRPLELDDLPGRLDALLSEVEEAAVIRGGRLFAEPVMAWLKRALAAGTAFGFAAADEAAAACTGLLTDRERAAGGPGLLQLIEDVAARSPGSLSSNPSLEPLAVVPAEMPAEAADGFPALDEAITPAPAEVPALEPVSVASSVSARSARSITVEGSAPDAGSSASAPMPWAPPVPAVSQGGRIETDHQVASRSPFAVLDAPPAPRPLSPTPAPQGAPMRSAELTPSPFQPPPPLVIPPAIPVVPELTPAPQEPAIRLKGEPPPPRSTIGIFEAPSEGSDGTVSVWRRAWLRFGLPWKLGAAAALVLAIGVTAKVQWSGGDPPAAAITVAPGVLVVETEPPGSELFINGEVHGVTPATLDVPPGRYDLTLTHGGATHAWAVDVASGARKVERLNWAALKPVGNIEIVSNTAGARVLLNGKPAGETPLTLTNLEPGRYTLVVQAPTGAIRRTVTVVAGQTAQVDAAIYSGWVLVSAPIELQVLENGRAIAVAGEGPILLPAGRHTLELVNDALGYRASRDVDIKPGEEERLVVKPTGTVNINALPWAEVWVDGTSLGETPLANVTVPLGTREIVFRHPEHGERKVSFTVKAGAAGQVAVDLSKPQG